MKGIEVRFSGRVARKPKQHLSRHGKLWTKIFVDVPIYNTDRDEPLFTWANIAIRGPDGDQFMDLQIGDEIRVEGELRLSSYEQNGRPQIGLTVNPTMIDRLIGAAPCPITPDAAWLPRHVPQEGAEA